MDRVRANSNSSQLNQPKTNCNSPQSHHSNDELQFDPNEAPTNSNKCNALQYIALQYITRDAINRVSTISK